MKELIGKYLSREYVVVFATIIGVIYESHTIPETSPIYKIMGLALAILGALGYATVRTVQKKTEAK